MVTLIFSFMIPFSLSNCLIVCVSLCGGTFSFRFTFVIVLWIVWLEANFRFRISAGWCAGFFIFAAKKRKIVSLKFAEKKITDFLLASLTLLSVCWASKMKEISWDSHSLSEVVVANKPTTINPKYKQTIQFIFCFG